MYAVIVSGGKQFRVEEGDVIDVEKLDIAIGDTVELEEIFKVDGDSIVSPTTAKAEVLSQEKGKKIIVFKYKAKKNERKKQGHRQKYTRIKILSI